MTMIQELQGLQFTFCGEALRYYFIVIHVGSNDNLMLKKLSGIILLLVILVVLIDNFMPRRVGV